jgi:protein tyrosine/serine phosphatase
MRLKILNRYRYLIVISIFLIGLGAIYWFAEEQGNFHTITAGEAYRSAQLDPDEFAYYISKYHIRSILNLRGKNEAREWYRSELKFSQANNVSHYDISLSAGKEPTKEDVQALLQIFSHASRPLLIHCQAGADRSGLVAAMWKTVVDKEPKQEAEKQLSIWYGHLDMGATSAMDNFFQKWNPAIPNPAA